MFPLNFLFQILPQNMTVEKNLWALKSRILHSEKRYWVRQTLSFEGRQFGRLTDHDFHDIFSINYLCFNIPIGQNCRKFFPPKFLSFLF